MLYITRPEEVQGEFFNEPLRPIIRRLLNIGDKKLRQMINESIDSNYQFAIQNGTKYLVNRKKFEKYLDTVTSI